MLHNRRNRLPSFAHPINHVVSNSLQEVPEVSAILQCCKNMSYFHKSCKAANKLTTIQSCLSIDNHKLIQKEEIYWNSSFHMLQRIIEQEEAIYMTSCFLNGNDLTIL